MVEACVHKPKKAPNIACFVWKKRRRWIQKKSDSQVKLALSYFDLWVKRDGLCRLKFFCGLKISIHPTKNCKLCRLTRRIRLILPSLILTNLNGDFRILPFYYSLTFYTLLCIFLFPFTISKDILYCHIDW